MRQDIEKYGEWGLNGKMEEMEFSFFKKRS